MANKEGTKPESRMLLETAVHSVLFYGAPLWDNHAPKKMVVKYMGPIQRKMAHIEISRYRSITHYRPNVQSFVTKFDIFFNIKTL